MRMRQNGYSLVEVSLALLVVAIGLTATFSLFPIGTEASRGAVDDVEVSQFAEYVFSTLELAAGFWGSPYGGTSWVNKINSGTEDGSVQSFSSGMFMGIEDDSNFDDVKIVTDRFQVFYWKPAFYGIGKLSNDLYKQNDFSTAMFTYYLTVEQSESKYRKVINKQAVPWMATLKVWPGARSNLVAEATAPYVFAREILPNF